MVGSITAAVLSRRSVDRGGRKVGGGVVADHSRMPRRFDPVAVACGGWSLHYLDVPSPCAGPFRFVAHHMV